MSAPSARVLRDGGQRQVPTAELVPGDVLLLEEGDTVPADARVLESTALRTAEAALTGESRPVLEGPAARSARTAGSATGRTWCSRHRGHQRPRPGDRHRDRDGDRDGTDRRLAAGRRSEAATPLQRELDRVGRLLGVAVIAIAVVVVRDHPAWSSRCAALSELVDVLLLAVSLAVAAVPEGLPAIVTIVLALGMQRMARRNAIVRRLSAVETLGSATVICSDKTGTLTRNEMTVRSVVDRQRHGGAHRRRLPAGGRAPPRRRAGRGSRAARGDPADARRPEPRRTTPRCSSRTAAGRSRATRPRARWWWRRARWAAAEELQRRYPRSARCPSPRSAR